MEYKSKRIEAFPLLIGRGSGHTLLMELELFLVLLVTTGLVEATRVGHLVPARSPFAALAYEEGRDKVGVGGRRSLVLSYRATPSLITDDSNERDR